MAKLWAKTKWPFLLRHHVECSKRYGSSGTFPIRSMLTRNIRAQYSLVRLLSSETTGIHAMLSTSQAAITRLTAGAVVIRMRARLNARGVREGCRRPARHDVVGRLSRVVHIVGGETILGRNGTGFGAEHLNI